MNNLFAFLLDAAATTGDGAAQAEVHPVVAFFYQYGSIILIVVMLIAMYFLMIRPQKKKQKEEQEMRNNVRIGDELTTIGGICGRVVNVKDDTLTIETGADRSKMQIKKWAIQTVETKHTETDMVNDDDDDDDDI